MCAEEHPDAIRRRIALYRDYLRAGIDGDLAQIYLSYITNAEARLAGASNEKRRHNSEPE